MRIQLQSCGNDLTLHTPKALARQAGLEPGAGIELSIKDGRLIVSPIAPWRDRLANILAEVTSTNLHPETDTGPDVDHELVE